MDCYPIKLSQKKNNSIVTFMTIILKSYSTTTPNYLSYKLNVPSSPKNPPISSLSFTSQNYNNMASILVTYSNKSLEHPSSSLKSKRKPPLSKTYSKYKNLSTLISLPFNPISVITTIGTLMSNSIAIHVNNITVV